MIHAKRGKIRSAVAASMLLVACSAKTASNEQNAAGAEAANSAAAPAANDTAAATPAAPPAGGLTADFMVGKWSAFGGDCSHTIEFRKDGTVTTPIGAAKWTVSGDTLTFDYRDGSKPTVSKVRRSGANEIEFTHESGDKETEKRC